MQFVDTHSHLYLNDFQNDIQDVMQRAQEKGTFKVILPNIDSASLDAMLALTKQYPDMCIPLPGLHPTHVKENFEEELERIYTRMDVKSSHAIGEIGIDLYWDKSFFRQQLATFEYQLSLAIQHDLPVVIHARDSFSEILEVIRKDTFTGLRGVFHAFTGDIQLAEELVERGFYLGLGGILTFKNSHLPEVAKEIALEHLVLETDSPFLAPTPHRGKRNESSYVALVAGRLAEIKGVSVEEVAFITTQNATKLFNI
jgi:TatD DNase family protein